MDHLSSGAVEYFVVSMKATRSATYLLSLEGDSSATYLTADLKGKGTGLGA
jgi:hypothetical protein